MRVIVAILLIVFSFYNVLAQERATIENLRNYKQKRITVSEQSILQLKESFLLVRLDFQKRKIDYFKKYNNDKEVNRIQEKQTKINEQIRDAIKTYYQFSPVYYFAMHDSEKLLKGEYDQVTFYNHEGDQIDAPGNIESKKWFIGEFGYTVSDTIAYYSGSTYETNDEDGIERERLYGGSGTSRPAFVIRNAKFEQLLDPFPYSIGYSFFGLVNKRYRAPMRKMNEKLFIYFNKVHGGN